MVEKEKKYQIKRILCSFDEWCREIVTGHEYVILDTETTGFTGEIIDLAIVNGQGRTLYNGLLRPKCKIEYGATKVHHINYSMVSKSRTFAQEWEKIYSVIKGKNIVAYNAIFDAGRLEHTAKVHGIKIENMVFYCAMLEYANTYNSKMAIKLERACEQQGVRIDQEHRALSDALHTLELIAKCTGDELLTPCIKCGSFATLTSPSGAYYCRKHGYCGRKTCLKSVEKFVLHPRMGIWVCPCVMEFELKMDKDVIDLVLDW
jgi:DNA polymerase-3 subunit epsilon